MQTTITEFVPPNGKQVQATIEIPDRYKEKIELLATNKCELACEVLSTTEIAQYIAHAEGDVDIEVCACKEECLTSLLKMLDRFTQASVDAFLEQIDSVMAEDYDFPDEIDDDYNDIPDEPPTMI